MDDLVKAMGAGGMSKSQASRLCAGIDVRVNAFLQRPPKVVALASVVGPMVRHARLWRDAAYVEVPDGGVRHRT